MPDKDKICPSAVIRISEALTWMTVKLKSREAIVCGCGAKFWAFWGLTSAKRSRCRKDKDMVT